MVLLHVFPSSPRPHIIQWSCFEERERPIVHMLSVKLFFSRITKSDSVLVHHNQSNKKTLGTNSDMPRVYIQFQYLKLDLLGIHLYLVHSQVSQACSVDVGMLM